MILLISVDVFLPDIFCRTSSSIFFFPWSLGNGFSPGLFCPHSYPTLFPGEAASRSFWGMDFLDFSRTFAEL
jgi:hypothetical protein